MSYSNIAGKIRKKVTGTKLGYFGVYTVAFVIVSIFVYWAFFSNNRCFVWSGSTDSKDGYSQHYKALMYFGQWCREIITTLFTQGKLVVPMWDFSIGYGSDIITSMHYYAYGDPLCLFSVLVPAEYTELLYNFLVLLRLYLAGMAFSLFCFKMDKGKMATMAGAFAYIFCGYTLTAAVRHPFFVNPMIYMPLMLWGAEKILRKERPYLFIVAAFVSVLSNFYFFYMVTIATVLYVAIRYFTMEREKSLKEFSWNVGKFALCGILAVGMAAAIFVPAVNVLLSSNRLAASGGGPELFYTVNYYEAMLSNFFAAVKNPSWTCLGWSVPVFVAICVMFMTRKKHTPLKIGFGILFVMTLFPIVGKVMNGFSYVNNRWTFILAAMTAYTLTSVWDDILAITKKKALALAGCFVLYCGILYKFNSQNTNGTYASLLLIFVIISVLCIYSLFKKRERIRTVVSVFLVLMVMLSCGVNAHFKFDPQQDNYIEEYSPAGTRLSTMETSSDKAAAYLVDENVFSRNEQDVTSVPNAAALTGSTGVQYFWSLENGNISEFLMENSLCAFISQKYDGLNSRAYLDALASVKYYIRNRTGKIPFGFEPFRVITMDSTHSYQVYKNKYALPLGYTYSSYIDKEDYLNMTAAERQQAMLQGVVLEDTDKNSDLKKYSQVLPQFTHEIHETEMKLHKNIVLQDDGSFLVNKRGAQMTLFVDVPAGRETYFSVSNVEVEHKTKYELYMDDCDELYSKEEFKKLTKSQQEELKRSDYYAGDPTRTGSVNFYIRTGKTPPVRMSYNDEGYSYSTGQQDFLVNLGYSENPKKKIIVKFPYPGVYRLENMQIISQPMEAYKEQIAELKEDVMENEVISTNKVEGEITLEQDKILCLSIPYSKGWKATVDGKETEILQANTMYCGLPLTAGTHKIVLTYSTPMLGVGIAVSMISFGIFIGLIIVMSKRKKSAKTKAAKENITTE